MIHQGRWNHVYKLWRSALSQENFPQFDRFLANEFAKNSRYGSKDRRWYSEVLFAAVRHAYFAVYIQSKREKTVSVSNSSEFFQALRTINTEDFFAWVYLRYNLNSTEILDEDFLRNIPKIKKDFFNNILLELDNNSLISKLIYHSVPPWFLESILERVRISNFNETQLNAFFENLDSRPPLWLRLNHLEKTTDVVNELAKESYEADVLGYSIKVTGAKGVFTLNSYKQGFFEIQDLASQQIGSYVKSKPKEFVWDCCAGGGGKTLQIASFLKNKGVIYASDIREYKLEEVKKRAKRSGFFNIRCLVWNGKSLPQFQKEVQLKGGFDWILVDAPCSSTGTWRRNPDAKYRIDKINIESLTKLQLSILTKASEALLPNGHIVYSTCSWICNENEGIVEQFLNQNPQFSLVEQNLLGSPFVNADTMFAAVLKRH